ncbi:MAG: hypothetical protein WDA13_03970 [Candidatus Shapirobacteria bacterium]|jgi:hypothetical protein
MKRNKIRNYVNLMRNCEVQNRRNELANKIYEALAALESEQPAETKAIDYQQPDNKTYPSTEQPVCETWGGSGWKNVKSPALKYGQSGIPCPDCQQPAEMKSGNDVRKLALTLRLEIAGIVCNGEKPHAENALQLVDELESIIDRQAKEIEELKSKRHITLTQAAEMSKFVLEKATIRAENAELKKRNEKLETALYIKGFIYEDELPKLSDEQFDLAFGCSKVDFVRLYPVLLIEALKGGE